MWLCVHWCDAHYNITQFLSTDRSTLIRYLLFEPARHTNTFLVEYFHINHTEGWEDPRCCCGLCWRLTCLISLPDSGSSEYSRVWHWSIDDTGASLSHISHQYKNRDALPLLLQHHKLRQTWGQISGIVVPVLIWRYHPLINIYHSYDNAYSKQVNY